MISHAAAETAILTVPGDYDTVDLAVRVAKDSLVSKVIIYAPDQTWDIGGKSIQWYEQSSPELVILGDGVDHPVLIDGKGGELLWETGSVTLQYVDVQDVRILLYGNAKFTTLANVDFLHTPNGTFPYPRLYMEGSAVCDLTLNAGGLSQLVMNDIAELRSATNLKIYSSDVLIKDNAVVVVAGDVMYDE
jgi:hypothetical protein